jgi:hypothetical protein
MTQKNAENTHSQVESQSPIFGQIFEHAQHAVGLIEAIQAAIETRRAQLETSTQPTGSKSEPDHSI